MVFNHKRADFWLLNFGFKRSLLSLLNYMMCMVSQICSLTSSVQKKRNSGQKLEMKILLPLVSRQL